MGGLVCPACRAEGEEVLLFEQQVRSQQSLEPIRTWYTCSRCRSGWERLSLNQMVRMRKEPGD